jgi:hypothetical protein
MNSNVQPIRKVDDENWKYVFVVTVLGLLGLLGLFFGVTLGQKMSRNFEESGGESGNGATSSASGSTSISGDIISMTSISHHFAEQPLKQYYVKSSYNSCAAGDFSNDFVTLAALTNAIRHGCRFLDFEIYDIGKEPIVAVSNKTTYHFKGSFNSIPLSEVLKSVKKHAFDTHNGRDPLFLQFRIKCAHVPVMNKISKQLNEFFGDRLMDNKYNYENGFKNMGDVPLSAFLGKVVIIVDTSNHVYKKSSLAEFVNIGANDVFNRMMTYSDLALNPPSDLLQFSKNNLLTCIPETTNASNYDSTAAFNQGAQFIAMKFQTNDDNLKLYNEQFDQYAFKLKPEDLKYVPIKIEQGHELPSTLDAQSILNSTKAGINTRVVETSNLNI